MVFLLLCAFGLCYACAYAPLPAMLVEIFLSRIRSTALQISFGWVAGFLPTITVAMAAHSGNMYYGLWYPAIVAAISFTIGMIFIKETAGNDIH